MEFPSLHSPAKFPPDLTFKPSIGNYAAIETQLLDPQTTEQLLNAVCSPKKTPLYALLSAFATTLYRISGETDGMFAFRAPTENFHNVATLSFNLDDLTS